MKKCVGGWLLGMTAVITMVTATACSSKEEAMVLDDWVEAGSESSSETDPGSALTDSMTVDEWVNSEEAVTFVKTFNNAYAENGITMELKAENDTLSMIWIYSEEALGVDVSGLTDEQIEEVHAMMQQQYDETQEQQVSYGEALKQAVGVSAIHIVYRASDGTELFSTDL